MTTIDFYILPTADNSKVSHFCCRLIAKARQKGNSIFVHISDPALAAELDDHLWTFDQQSFHAHSRLNKADKRHIASPIVLATDAEPPQDYDLLINLSDETPLFFSRFPRMVEIITERPEAVSAGREKFRYYRDRGYPLETHKIEA